MIPAYFFSVLNIVVSNAGNFKAIFLQKKMLIRTVLQFRGDSYSFCFFPTIFSALLIVFVIHKYIKSNIGRLFITLAISLIGGFYILIIKKQLPFNIDSSLAVCWFVELGSQLKNIDFHIAKKQTIIISILWIVLLILNHYCLGNGSVALGYGDIHNPFMFLIIGSLGSLMILGFCMIREGNKLLEKYGKNSMTIYVIHLMIVLRLGLVYNFKGWLALEGLILAIVFSLILCQISLLISELMGKLVPFLVGKRR